MKHRKPFASMVLVILVLCVTAAGCGNPGDAALDDSNSDAENCAGGPSVLRTEKVTPWDSIGSYPTTSEYATFEGYAKLASITIPNAGRYTIYLNDDTVRSKNHIAFVIPGGTCENTILLLPLSNTEADFVIYDNEGNEIRPGDKMRVTGKVQRIAMPYTINAGRIDKL